MSGSKRVIPHERRCTAKSKRTHRRCANAAMLGKDKCRHHGGKTPIKHGLYSKYGPPKAIADQIAEHENDPKVLDHRHLGAHVYGLLLAQLQGKDELQASDAENLLPILDKPRRIATDYHRLAIDSRFVDLVEAKALIGGVVQAVLRYVPEEKRREAIHDAERLIGGESVSDSQPSVH